MMFDSTISLGNLLTIGGFLVFTTLYVASARNMSKLLAARLETIDAQIEDFKREISKLTEVTVKQAQQDERVLYEGRRLDELERRFNRVAERLGDLGALKSHARD